MKRNVSNSGARLATRATMIVALLMVGAAAQNAGNIPEAMREKMEICGACHGANGVSENPDIPSLAAQPDLFTQWQLIYMRDESRKVEAMAPLMKDMTDADVRFYGAYYASLPPPPASKEPLDPELAEAAKRLIKPRHCDSCHKDKMEGQGEIPRLAGQHETFLAKSLHDYRTNARRGRGNAAMAGVSYALTDADIKALAHYLARLE